MPEQRAEEAGLSPCYTTSRVLLVVVTDSLPPHAFCSCVPMQELLCPCPSLLNAHRAPRECSACKDRVALSHLASAWRFGVGFASTTRFAFLPLACLFSCLLLPCPHTPHNTHAQAQPTPPQQPCLFLPPCLPYRSRTLLLPLRPAALPAWLCSSSSPCTIPPQIRPLLF